MSLLPMLLLRALLLLAGAVGLTLIAAQFGLFQGRAPTDLGVHDGRLKPPANTPNSVSSQADLYPDHPQRDFARIAPLNLRGDGAQSIARLREVLAAMPGARVVESRDDYLRAEFTTRWMRYIDDVELWFDPAAVVVQVRSASRVGHGDLGANRRRVEALRAALAAP
jgi:uncharacterized protein (DUF1499 family)